MIEGEDGIIRLQEKVTPALSEPVRVEKRSYTPQRSASMTLKSF
jgi:hypothetical protein